jgi:PAS domain S-box-containing protein
MMAEIWRWLSWTVVGVALLSVVGIALALWMAQNIARSIQALIVPALALGRGEPISVGNFDLAETSEVGESLAKASELLRRQKEELLQKSEQRYHSLFENMLDGFAYCKMLYDGEGRPLDFIYLDVNSEFARITGLQNVEGKRGTEVLPGIRESHPELFETYGRVALTGRPERFEIELKPLGIWFFISVYSTDKGYFTAVFHNITEKKRAEQALVRSEKLASVGRMAATIAHEINNPLAAAMNALYLVWSSPEVPDSARTNLDLAEQELERVAHITKQTLGFYRETGNSTTVQLPDLLDDVLMMYGPKLNNKNASVERRYRCGASVYAIEGEVRQVVSNLIANGIDAMPQNGTLYVRTSGPSTANGLPAMVQLTIADNGSGIPPENMRQIFEPFFTTKQSVGTGLGLWVTKELVRKHDGKLRVRSRVGEGTVFVIWLPTERRKQEREKQF